MAAEESKINSAITFSSIDEGTPMPEFACEEMNGLLRKLNMNEIELDRPIGE